MPEEIDKTLLQIESDLASINRTIRDIDRVTAAGKRMADEAKKTSLVGEQSSKKLVAAYKAVADAAEKARKEAEKSRKEIEKSLSTKDAFGKASTGVGSLASVASGVAGSGAAEGLRLVGDVSGAAEQIPALVSSIGALGPVGIAGGAAVAGLALVLGSAISETQRLTEATKKRLDTEAEIIRLATTGTREELEARRDAIGKQIEAERVVFERRNAELQQATEGLGVFDQFRETVNLAFGEVDALRDKQTESLDTLTSLTSAYNDAELALVRNETAANDMAKAEEELAAKREQFAGQLVDVQISALTRAASLSSEQAKERLQQIQDEQAILQRFADSGAVSAEKAEEFRGRIAKLGVEFSTLAYEVIPLIEAREEETRAIQEQEKTFQSTAKAVEKFNTDIAALEARTAEQRIAINERYADVAVDLAEKQADALSSRDDALIEAGLEAGKTRAENERKANADREDEEKRHRDALKQIDSDFKSAKRNAVQNRDVLAVQAAEDARRQALKDENKSNKDRLSEIDKALSEQNAAIDDKLREQTAAVQKRYNEQLDAAQKASDKQRAGIRADAAALDSKYAAEILKRNQANVAELNLIAAHYTTREAIERQYLERLNQQAQQFLFSSTTIAPTQDTGTVIPFASGGNAPANRDLLVGERGPERIRLPQGGQVFNANQTRQMGGGNSITVPITVNGRRQRDIEVTTKVAVHRELDRILREAGVK